MATPGKARTEEEEALRYREKEREEQARLEREERDARAAETVEPAETSAADEPARKGDILGLSDVSPDVEIPQASRDHGGHPAGIEVRERTSGAAELKQSKGATGIDMGAAGSGTDLDPNEIRPKSPTDPND